MINNMMKKNVMSNSDSKCVKDKWNSKFSATFVNEGDTSNRNINENY